MRSIGGAIVSVVLAAGLHGMSLAADGSAHGGQVSAPPKVSQRLAIEPGEPAPKELTALLPAGFEKKIIYVVFGAKEYIAEAARNSLIFDPRNLPAWIKPGMPFSYVYVTDEPGETTTWLQQHEHFPSLIQVKRVSKIPADLKYHNVVLYKGLVNMADVAVWPTPNMVHDCWSGSVVVDKIRYIEPTTEEKTSGGSEAKAKFEVTLRLKAVADNPKTVALYSPIKINIVGVYGLQQATASGLPHNEVDDYFEWAANLGDSKTFIFSYPVKRAKDAALRISYWQAGITQDFFVSLTGTQNPFLRY